MFTVYVLLSYSTNRFYVGQTGNLERRLYEHYNGCARYTKNRGPWALVYSEEWGTRGEAMERERYLKTGEGKRWLREKLNGRAGPPGAD